MNFINKLINRNKKKQEVENMLDYSDFFTETEDNSIDQMLEYTFDSRDILVLRNSDNYAEYFLLNVQLETIQKLIDKHTPFILNIQQLSGKYAGFKYDVKFTDSSAEYGIVPNLKKNNSIKVRIGEFVNCDIKTMGEPNEIEQKFGAEVSLRQLMEQYKIDNNLTEQSSKDLAVFNFDKTFRKGNDRILY